jgi:hypothetical protein
MSNRIHRPVSLAELAELAERQLMGRAPMDDVMRTYLARGGKLIDRGTRKGSNIVRNRMTGRILPCCWSDCMVNGNKRIRVAVPHDTPRWEGEKQIYIFCSDSHKAMWLAGTPYENRA